MKSTALSMTPDESAEAFYGLDDVSFAKALEKITGNDPRLSAVFQATRARFLRGRDDNR